MQAKRRNRVVREILTQFLPRFIPRGQVVWVSGNGAPVSRIVPRGVSAFQIPASVPEVFPDVIIHDKSRRWLFLIDVAGGRWRMNAQRCDQLLSLLRGCGLGLVIVSAFRERGEFRRLADDFAWGTAAWFASEPDHLIHFNGGILTAPHDVRNDQ